MFGVEPICKVLTSHGLKIATSTCYAAKNRTPSARSVRDAELKTQISRVNADNFGVYGVRKVWRQMHREGIPVACCTVARLIRDLGLEGARRGKKIRTTIRDDGRERACDLLGRDFTASRPNERWVADFTYAATPADRGQGRPWRPGTPPPAPMDPDLPAGSGSGCPSPAAGVASFMRLPMFSRTSP
ncbi:IS3 family transposase [Streptomyces sp. TRM 70351]|uniref:IS3 family transposase n=1 Tax=Streptomyces sp. TRM 70351 TaxID=3116552 RepID=UPI002E7BFF23|nr:IS3 family transposase [Streptomyces sp. TRM 70351]MEE1928844.1 IS3 family transposase [Streptomyces sp. TRM 70351]